jgi:signal transduction histidine kinase/ActR/RegA family two-component response regulator
LVIAAKTETGAEIFQKPALKIGESLSGLVALQNKPMVVPDLLADPRHIPEHKAKAAEVGIRAVVLVPVRGRQGVLGILSVQSRSPRTFTPEEVETLSTYADQAAIAIENARLFAELNQSYRDLQQAQAELIRAEKLRALGQMAAGIAHDLNNMLAAILGQVELLRLRRSEPAVQERLHLLETAARDGAHVVRRLQDFARQQPTGPLEPVNLPGVIQEAVSITRPRWRDEPQRRGVVIQLQTLLDELPPILGQAAEVREVLTNLIFNAVDAMPSGGTLTIRAYQEATQGVPGSGQTAEHASSLPAASCLLPAVVVEVADTGVGMSEEVKARIFDPFFTTKGGLGTGLGLSVVYGIMERHGGRLEVASAPGQGTTFTLRFQVATAAAPEERRDLAHSLPARRILLIDDDPMVRQTVASLLRTVGHTVEEADGGAAGIRRLTEGPVDLVLTDLGMPEVTGWDVARAVKAYDPHLPVILLTGWGEHVSPSAAELALVDRVMGKPFHLKDLLGAVAELTADKQ